MATKKAVAKKAVAKKAVAKKAVAKTTKIKSTVSSKNENNILDEIDYSKKGFDPKGRAVTLEVVEGGFLVEKENVEHWKMTFTKDEYNNAELWFVHAVDCSHN